MIAPVSIRRTAWATLGWSLAVVVYGAFVRATKSGDGCGAHWPACNGEVIPTSPTLRTVIEFTHRATSGVALALTVALFAVAFLFAEKRHPVRTGAALSLFFMLMEAAVGAVLVKTGWVAMNESLGRAIFMSVHLVNTFFLIASLTLTTYWAHGGARLSLRGHGMTGLLVLGAMASVVLLGVSGAVTALGDTLFPTPTLAEGLAKYSSPAAHILLPLRLLHPVIAMAVAILTFSAGSAALAQRNAHLRLRRAAVYLAIAFGLQFAAGISNVWLLAPTWLQLFHLLFADLVWIALVYFGALTFAASPSTEPAVAPAPSAIVA